MSRCVVVHAGFHKTGTTTTQATLLRNGKALWPTHAVVLPGRLTHVLRMATLHSTLRDALTLAEFRHRLDAFLATLDLGARRGLVLSAENLSGLIPGRKEVTGYDAAPALLAETARALAARWPDLDLHVILTTRDPAAWLRSTWWQNLRSSRLTEDLESYAARLGPGLDLSATVEAVTAAVRAVLPGASVRAAPIEPLRDAALGPATPVLEAMGLAPATLAALEPAPAMNAAPDAATVTQVLALNRGPLDAAACRAAKAALLGLDNV